MFGALILLGFAYCDENSMGAGSENCTSYAKYEFRGKVLGREPAGCARCQNSGKAYRLLLPTVHMAMLFYTDTVYTKETESIFIRIP